MTQETYELLWTGPGSGTAHLVTVDRYTLCGLTVRSNWEPAPDVCIICFECDWRSGPEAESLAAAHTFRMFAIAARANLRQQIKALAASTKHLQAMTNEAANGAATIADQIEDQTARDLAERWADEAHRASLALLYIAGAVETLGIQADKYVRQTLEASAKAPTRKTYPRSVVGHLVDESGALTLCGRRVGNLWRWTRDNEPTCMSCLRVQESVSPT